MTPSQRAKELGCKSLTLVSKLTEIPKRTLEDWHYNKPLAFQSLCKLVAFYERNKEVEQCEQNSNTQL